MPSDPDIYAVEWLHAQLDEMKGWRLSMERQGQTDPRLAAAIARHENWLEARLGDLVRRAA
ncbi:hypothetical protein [Henriciella aquimarina]|uniref:hypothetical protein n=1 Tax=Henriciella aquimarina TaxID=545261 RepID=UPI000A06F486|nr:hypothetical protein [Henriciella aquimarina]